MFAIYQLSVISRLAVNFVDLETQTRSRLRRINFKTQQSPLDRAEKRLRMSLIRAGKHITKMEEFLKKWEAPRVLPQIRLWTTSKSAKTCLLNTTVSYLNTDWNFTAKSRDSSAFHSECVAQVDIFALTVSPIGSLVTHARSFFSSVSPVTLYFSGLSKTRLRESHCY